MTKKILIFVFIILFVLLIAEIGYLFYTPTKPATTRNNQSNSTTGTDVVIPSPSPELQPTQTVVQTTAENSFYQTALNNYLSLANAGILKRAFITADYSGKILEINSKNIDTSKFSPEYKPILMIKFELLDKDKSDKPKVISMYFNQAEYDKAVVGQTFSKSVPTATTMKDLQVGQTINVTEIFKLLNNNRIILYSITIVSPS